MTEIALGWMKELAEDALGNATMGLAVTATLRVSPNGSGEDGLTWRTAYQTIQAALDVASADPEDLTLVLIASHATYYDIDTTGDPTWAANVILCGSIPDFVQIRNTHVAATSILKLTGSSAIIDLQFYLGTGSLNGVIMTGGGATIIRLIFDGTGLTGAATAMHLDGSGPHAHHARALGCTFHGHISHMTGLLIDEYSFSNFDECAYHQCLIGIKIVGTSADENDFANLDIGNCALGIDIDAGNNQHFHILRFHGNVRNVDDEVGDHDWSEIIGPFNIAILPDNLIGINVATGGAGAYGGDTELLAAAGRDNPFRIVGVNFEPDAAPAEWYQVRFSDDSGVTFYDVLMFQGVKREGIAAPSGTEHIFNAGTRISASARDVSGGDNVLVWVEIQEI